MTRRLDVHPASPVTYLTGFLSPGSVSSAGRQIDEEEQQEPRRIFFNHGQMSRNLDGSQVLFPGNSIKTSRYTCLSFIPMNLFEQFLRFGNLYFLCMSIILYLRESIPLLSMPLFVGTVKTSYMVIHLAIVLSANAALTLLDDLRRREADSVINSRKTTEVIPKRHRVTAARKTWAQVCVGDVLMVQQDEEFPADMVLLYSSGHRGSCYVSTTNISGENCFKFKTAPGLTQSVIDTEGRNERDVVDNLRKLSGRLKVEPPSKNIHAFRGSLRLSSETDPRDLSTPPGKTEELCNPQLLLRGTVLRDTDMCLGMVVYCGLDTRMVRNSRPAPRKQSNLERTTNSVMLVILGLQIAMTLLSSAGRELHESSHQNYWYLHQVDPLLPDVFAYWLTFFTLYSDIMPITFYLTTDLCNLMHAYFLRNDRNLFWKELGLNEGKGFPARARSPHMCQDLGQVSYIFADKTGTLTRNAMELRRMSIAGHVYGELTPQIRGFSGRPQLLAARRSRNGKAIDAFLEALCLAHTAEVSTADTGRLRYEAESPDERVLVKMAAELGWAFCSRTGSTLRCECTDHKGSKSKREYNLLAINKFTSERRRMSVVVQHGSEYWLFAKGADDVMLQRASHPSTELEEDLREFAREGLRTLVVGARKLSSSEVKDWQGRLQTAGCRAKRSWHEVEKVVADIETPLEILGATGIEDRLQDQVPEAITKIRAAGIKLWVLTGDGLESARTIGFSTGVLSEEMSIQVVHTGEDIVTASASFQKSHWPAWALLITGAALEDIFESNSQKHDFLELSKACSALVACRVSPMQKAQVVRLVQEGLWPRPVTLAVGDGANDVNMIQEACVGIGILGREGRQAVNSSDFAIGQFSLLQHLLFVHGHGNYQRMCKVTLFLFWRNMVLVLLLFFYTSVCAYSGTTLFERWICLPFNIACSLPITAVGCFDREVKAKAVLQNPRLYKVGRLVNGLGVKQILSKFCSAFAHSAIIFVVNALATPAMELHGDGDYYTFGTMVYSCFIVDMSYRVIILTSTHNRYTFVALLSSVLGYVCWLSNYPQWQWFTNLLEPNMYMVPYHLVRNPHFWICIGTVLMLITLLDVFIPFLCNHRCTDLWDKMQRWWQDPWGDHHLHDEVEVGLGRTIRWEEDSPMLRLKLKPNADLDSDSEDNLPEYSANDLQQLDLSDFGQQRLQWRVPSVRSPVVKYGAITMGIIASAMGATMLITSSMATEIQINYSEGVHEASWFWRVMHRGTVTEERDCDGFCRVQVVVPRHMEPPISVGYVIDPFYQNHKSYLNSEASGELLGLEVSWEVRADSCRYLPSRELRDGSQIVPCGMKATSLFNDTFAIAGVPIDRRGTAWKTDVERYSNPPDYPRRAGTSWLFQRYPGLVPADEGVKSEAFATWMRPSATPYVWKPYGYIWSPLRDGQVLNITISSAFPARTLGANKLLTLTEHTPLGGHQVALGMLLMSGGVLSFTVAYVVCCTCLD